MRQHEKRKARRIRNFPKPKAGKCKISRVPTGRSSNKLKGPVFLDQPPFSLRSIIIPARFLVQGVLDNTSMSSLLFIENTCFETGFLKKRRGGKPGQELLDKLRKKGITPSDPDPKDE